MKKQIVLGLILLIAVGVIYYFFFRKPPCVATGCGNSMCVAWKDYEAVQKLACLDHPYHECFKLVPCGKIKDVCDWKPSQEFVTCLENSNAPNEFIQKYRLMYDQRQ